jgi:hypothetical protein
MIPFDPANKEHRAIALSAMCAADALGTGRLSAVREQLLFNDIEPGLDGTIDHFVFSEGQKL